MQPEERQQVAFTMSGRRDSNPRLLAWEANALPLSYYRIALQM